MSLSGQSQRAIAGTHGVQSDLDLRAHYMTKAWGVPFVACSKNAPVSTPAEQQSEMAKGHKATYVCGYI